MLVNRGRYCYARDNVMGSTVTGARLCPGGGGCRGEQWLLGPGARVGNRTWAASDSGFQAPCDVAGPAHPICKKKKKKKSFSRREEAEKRNFFFVWVDVSYRVFLKRQM